MKITNKAKLKEALELLIEAQDLVNDSIELEDSELGGVFDSYRKISDVISDIEDEV